MVFKIDPAGQQTVLHAFHGGTDGALIDSYSSEGMVRDADGNLYGTTTIGGDLDACWFGGPGCRVVYKLSACSSALCRGE